MEFVVTLVGGNTYKIPASAIDSQRKLMKGKIESILPEDLPKPVIPEQLPSAVTDLDSMKTLKELKEYCIEKQIPPSKWQHVKNVKQLRKILKNEESL